MTESQFTAISLSMPAGRPSSFTQDMADRICAYVAAGNTLRSFCALPGNPDHVTVYGWIVRNEDFATAYAQAREQQQEARMDQIIEIAQSVVGSDSMAAVTAARLHVDTLKWVIAKLAPRKYGDQIKVEHSGSLTLGVLIDRVIELRGERQKEIGHEPALQHGCDMLE